MILAYAETESGVDGTVNGISSTKNGKNITPDMCTRYSFFSSFFVIICQLYVQMHWFEMKLVGCLVCRNVFSIMLVYFFGGLL